MNHDEPVVYVKSARGPWALLFLLLLAFGALGYYGWQMLQKAWASADHAVETRDALQRQAEASQKASEELKNELNEAVTSRDEALAKVKILEANLE